MKRDRILHIRDLHISFATAAGKVQAVRGVNLDLYRGETLAVVGESGSGKSVTMKAIMGILSNNGTIDDATIEFTTTENGKPITYNIIDMSQKEIRRRFSGKKISMVFQDPLTSLNPTMAIGTQLMEGMRHHYGIKRSDAYDKAVELLDLVKIPDPVKHMKSYPHQLSGGMRQRVVIAIALSCDPEILICDEPTTALDVTIQAKILELIQDIQKKRNLSVIYITHDLGVVAKIADYVNVMYAGKIVEQGAVDEVFYGPRHPYTWGLLSSIPNVENPNHKLFTIPGTPPNLFNTIIGDAFAPRNAFAIGMDFIEEPPMFKITKTHYASTWLLDPRAERVEMPRELRARIDGMLKENK